MTDTALVHRLTVSQLVTAYAQSEADIHAALGTLRAAEDRVNAALMNSDGDLHRGWTVHVHERLRLDDVDDIVAEFRRRVWQQLVHRIDLRGMMSSERWTKLQREIEKGAEVPPITMEAMEAFVGQVTRDIPTMAEEKVREVFEWLRPHNSTHKTNSEMEVPPRVILGHVVEWVGYLGRFRVNYDYAQQKLIALQAVFQALDGKGHVVRSTYSDIENMLTSGKGQHAGEVPYFRFRAFRNGNLHVAFTRLDLLAQLNRIAGGARLRP